MPNGETAVATRAVGSGLATQIQAYGKHQHVPGRTASHIPGQTKALKRGIKERGWNIKVGKSNKGIGTAKQQVSNAAARAKSEALGQARTGDRAWRNRHLNKQSKAAAKRTINRKRRERRAAKKG